MQIETALIGHVHGTAFPVTSPPVDPISITANVLTCVDNVMQLAETNMRQFNHASFQANFLTPGSPTYILSPLNNTT